MSPNRSSVDRGRLRDLRLPIVVMRGCSDLASSPRGSDAMVRELVRTQGLLYHCSDDKDRFSKTLYTNDVYIFPALIGIYR